MMWCQRCHYGSERANFLRCPLCGCTEAERKSPFPTEPTRMGSKAHRGHDEQSRRMQDRPT